MFGRNEISKRMQDPEGKLLVNDVFYTFQGEGPDAGRPAVFLRLSKCNLRCFFCDTEFESGEPLTARQTFDRIMRALPNVCDLVVITGGEPLLQNINPLVRLLNANKISVAVETAGTTWLPGLSSHFQPDRSIKGNIIVCSPKTPVINAQIEQLIGAFKYIIRSGETSPDDGLPMRSTQIPGYDARIARPKGVRHPSVQIYVQACDEQNNPEASQINLELAASLAMTHGYRLSVQTHKLAKVP
jgi:organic radical activating enzyme